ncbi:TauD/TfdA family dioxygenase [Acidimicrobiales bacterium]|nr:TauD/TfdA family dioxygenase [Acidimicrobiaceae bacterium]MDB9846221.1 TauD/TfdA family dioxygenase [Acidimicrobiales bacterium]MDC0349751.1 TauD/TfdA family dioxygenase [bacterium]
MSVVEAAGLSYHPISPKFGAELTDIVLLDLHDDEVESLQQLAAERGVVVVRDQTMTVHQQAEFAHRLGPLTTYPVRNEDVPSELLVIHADENSKNVAGSKWHTDISSEERPPSLSMLRMEVVPSSGGDTLFSDMYQAFESLSPEMQRFLKRLSARHDPKGHHLYLSGAKTLRELPSQIHPVIRTHPRTGRNALYVNSGFTARIQDVTRGESDALLAMLFDHIIQGLNFQIRVRWEPNTVVFWDNRVVQHHAAWDYYPQVRHGYRATSIGEIPYLATH